MVTVSLIRKGRLFFPTEEIRRPGLLDFSIRLPYDQVPRPRYFPPCIWRRLSDTSQEMICVFLRLPSLLTITALKFRGIRTCLFAGGWTLFCGDVANEDPGGLYAGGVLVKLQ